METELDEPVLEELDRDECLRLLATQSVGRVAIGQPEWAPHVVPVNYVMLRDSVVFRTDRGKKLRLVVTEPVSFEVDFADPFRRTGWSVLVQGLAYQASNWEIEVEDIHVEPFAPGKKSSWVRLVPHSITGRRVRLPAVPELDPRGYL
jgi:nitroimidazol reductase NimA-like FMN-containing flavoprotein (pyridoxamine 5'-phosphate oxidase superfamily)